MTTTYWLSLSAVVGVSLTRIASAQQTAPLHVCIGVDRVLRSQTGMACGAGQSAYWLFDVGEDKSAPPTAADLADLKRKLASLTQEVSRLEGRVGSTVPHTIGAPFTVIDKNDNKLLDVRDDGSVVVTAPFDVNDQNGKGIFGVKLDPRGMRIMDAAGNPVAVATAMPDGGGFFKAFTVDLKRVAVLGAVPGMALVTVRDGSDLNRAMMTVTKDGLSTVSVLNKTHMAVASLAQGTRGDGLLQVSNSLGGVRIEGGVTEGGLGVVRAGPRSNCSGKMGLVAPDCIVGHQ